MKHLFTFRQRPNESLTGKLARVSSDTRSRVSAKCRPTVGRLSTLFLLLALSFGFSSQAWANSSWKITGSMNSWNTSSGFTTSGSQTISLEANKEYSFKVYVSGWNDKWWSNADEKITKTKSSIQYYNNSGDSKITTKLAGDYKFTWDESNKKLSVTYPEKYFLTGGDFGGWDAAQNEMTNNGDGTWSWTSSSVAAGKHEFKITDGTWTNQWDCGELNTLTNCTKSCSNDGDNAAITTTTAGTITFTFVVSTKKINVTGPTPTYLIRFLNHDGSVLQSGQVAKGQTPSYTGSTPTKPATAEYTYSFTGWSPTIAAVTKAQDYTAQFSSTAKSYTLTWDLDGGTAGTGTITDSPCAYGTVLQYTVSPTKTGYDFKGWSPTMTSGTTTMPAANTTYKAQWQVKTTNITFDRQDGQGGTGVTTATYGSAMPGITPPTKAGNIFKGYFDAQSGGTKYYNANGTSAKNWDKEDAAKTLYAQWDAITVSAILDHNTGAPGSHSLTFTITTNAPANSGYYCEVTNFGKGSAGPGLIAGDWQIVENPHTKSFTVTFSEAGTWVAEVHIKKDAVVQATYQVTFTAATVINKYSWAYGTGTGYTSMGNVESTVAAGTEITEGTSITVTATPSSEDYVFEGWYSEAACTNKVTDTNPYTFSLSANTALYAKFKNATKYTVSYAYGTGYSATNGTISAAKTTGGAAVTNGSQVVEGTSVTFTATENTGYKFAGWYSDAACTGLVSNNKSYVTTINAATSLYAKWLQVSDITIYVKASDCAGLVIVDGWKWVGDQSTQIGNVYLDHKTTIGGIEWWYGTIEDVTKITGLKINGADALQIYKFENSTITENLYTDKQGSVFSKVTVEAGTGGTITAGAGEHFSSANTPVTITAQANDGYLFSGWTKSGDGASKISIADASAISTTFTVSNDGLTTSNVGTITANFQQLSLSLEVTTPAPIVAGETSVTIKPTLTAPAGQYTICYKLMDEAGTAAIDPQPTFTINDAGVATFTPATEGNYKIQATVHQGKDACGDAAILTATTDITVNPNLELNWYLAGSFTDWGNGKIAFVKPSAGATYGEIRQTFDMSDPAPEFKIIGGSTWYGHLGDKQPSTMTKDDCTDWEFKQSTGGDNNTTLTLTVAGTYTFRFNPIAQTLSVIYPETHKLTVAAGTGIASVGGGVNYAVPGTDYELTAELATGYENLTWTPTGAGATVRQDGNTWYGQVGSTDATFTASATAQLFAVTMPTSVTGKYDVTYTGEPSVAVGSTVEFTVTPATGYDVVVKMNGETLTGTDNAYSFTMPAAIAEVTVDPSLHNYNITMAVSPANSGTTTPTGSFTKTYQESFAVTAEAAEGYEFANWTSSDNAITVAEGTATLVNAQDATLTANFTEIKYTVSVNDGSSSSDKQVGVTPVDIVAAAAADVDHQFKKWEFTGDVVIADVNQANTTITATGAGTVTATYEPIPMYYTHGTTSTFADPDDKQLMSYDETEEAYYIDIATDCKPYFYRFKTTDNKLYSADWAGEGLVVKEVELNGAKVDANIDVTDWEYKSSIQVNLNAGSAIRVWFKNQTTPKQTWITGKNYITLTYGTSGDLVGTSTLEVVASQSHLESGVNDYPKGTTFTFTATPESGKVVEGWFWDAECPDNKRYTGGDMNVTEYPINNAQQDVYMYVRFDHLNTVNVRVAEGQESMGTVKPTNGRIDEVGKYAIGIAEAESKDPTLYSFDYWTLPDGVTLHDSCTIHNAEIRVNATTNDALLIANFKARDVVTLYFVNSDNWSDVKVHLWGGTEEGTKWPGISPKKENIQVHNHDVYSITFDNGAYKYAQWNCGKNDCQSLDITIDKTAPVYNAIDGRLYPSLEAVLPDPVVNQQWKVKFNNESHELDIVNYDNSHIWTCEVVTDITKGNDFFMRGWNGSGWEDRRFTQYEGQDLSNKLVISTYPSGKILVNTSNSGQEGKLAGFSENTAITFTFNDDTRILTVDYTQPSAILTVSSTSYDVDSNEPLVLHAYAKNATADTYQFFYKENGGSDWRSLGDPSATNVMEVTADQLSTVHATLGTYQFRVVITTTFKNQQVYPEAVKSVEMYKYYWLALKDEDNWANHIYVWKNGGAVKTAYPGDALTIKEGDWHFYQFQYPTYDRLVWNGTGDNKSGDITFDPNKLCHEKGSQNWNINTNATCPYRIYRDFPANEYWISLDGTLTLTPTIRYYGSDELTYTWTITSGDGNVVLSSTNTAQTIVNPTAIGDATVKFVVSDGTGESHEYNITIHVIKGITIRVYKRYESWIPVIHTWGTGEGGGDFDMTNEGNGWYSHTSSLNPVNFMVKKDKNTSNNYEKTIDVTDVTESGCWIVSESQWSGGGDDQKHMIDKTEDCALYFRVHETMADGKTTYHSNKVKKSGDDLSFYAATDGTLTLQHYDESAGKFVDMKTLANPTASNVQVAKFTGSDVDGMKPYVGDFYIRASVAGNGDWSQYVDNNHVMTQFARNANFPNEMYSYYWVRNVAKGNSGKTYVGAAVANAINDDLAGIIQSDVFTIQGEEDDNKINNSTNGTNIRFGYEPTTNYFKRAMINGSSDDHFLEVYGDNSTYFNGGKVNSTMYKTNALADADIIYRDDVKSENYSLKFTDMSDWVYQAQVFARVDNTRSNDTKAIIASLYNDKWNYLLGYDEVNQCPTQAWTVLGNTSTKNITYDITLIYDFKTNRLLSAWTPSDMDIDKSMEVDADVMFLRHENNDVAQINVKNTTAVVENLNGVVFVLEVEDDKNKTDGNQEKHYWITLPFDVNVSDIFGIEGFYDGQTGTTWGIQRYRGDLRAQKGWFIETPTFWEWQKRTDVLHKGEGYLVTIDKTTCNFKAIDDKSILRLYFPCKQSMKMSRAYSTEDLTVEYPDQPCKITRDNRHLQDGNWKMIGAVGYTNCEATAAANHTEDYMTPFPNFRYRHTDGPTPSQQSYMAEAGYTQDKEHPVIYRAFFSYPVQYAGTITWAPFTKDDQLHELAPRRYAMENEVTNATLRLELQQNGKMMDQTFVQLCEGATNSFDQNLDLIKFGCGAAISEISTLDENDIAYGGNSVPVDTKVIPVAVNIKVAGTYTFAMPAGTEQMTVYLLDYETGDKIDLGLGNYTVTFSKKANIKDRFALQIDNRKLPTDTKVIDANGNELIKFIRNEQMYILRDGRLYNANGAELSK